MHAPHTPFLLAILDGLALNPEAEGNAVKAAETPVLDRLLGEWPHTTLVSHGRRVGLPEGQMGNSEVGHLNIGAGRVVEQDLTRIDRAIEESRLGDSAALRAALSAAAEVSTRAVHFIGLLSLGGVHSQSAHLKALVNEALKQGVGQVFVHAITDGRDRPPTAALEEVGAFYEFIKELNKQYPDRTIGLASLIGRYYTMDRDKRWERTKRGYDLLTLGEGEVFSDPLTALKARYEKGQTDEFLEPIVLTLPEASRSTRVEDDDVVVFFNFRADRMRQIVPAFFQPVGNFSGFERTRIPRLNSITTMTEYEDDYPVKALFPQPEIRQHLGEVLAEKGLRQLRIAETEKYAHVTYFFNGGVEQPLSNEARLLIPSPRDVPTYDLKPQMSAIEVTDSLLAELSAGNFDVCVLNFANCDMVGHAGVFEAAVRAVETVDTCLGRLLAELDARGGAALIIADHGNADQMLDYQTGGPHTFHTMHPVPCILYGRGLKQKKLRDGGALCDVAPTVLDLLNLDKPQEMTGQTLLKID